MNLLKPFTALAGRADHAIKMRILMSVARHAATALGGVLMTYGYLDMNHVADFVGGLMALVGAVSGSAQKVAAAE